MTDSSERVMSVEECLRWAIAICLDTLEERIKGKIRSWKLLNVFAILSLGGLLHVDPSLLFYAIPIWIFFSAIWRLVILLRWGHLQFWKDRMEIVLDEMVKQFDDLPPATKCRIVKGTWELVTGSIKDSVSDLSSLSFPPESPYQRFQAMVQETFLEEVNAER